MIDSSVRIRLTQTFVSLPLWLALTGGVALAADNGANTPAHNGGDGPQVTIDKTFGSWGMSCATANGPDGKPMERCMVSQLVTTQPKSGKVLLGVTVDYVDSPTIPTIRFRFAPMAKQSAGIGIKIDQQPEMRLAINDCDSKRCEAVGRLAPKVLSLWQKGRMAQLAFIEQGGKQMLLPVSLSGLDQALAELRRRLKTLR